MKKISGFEGSGRQKKSMTTRRTRLTVPPNMKIGRRPIILIKYPHDTELNAATSPWHIIT